MPVPQVHSRRLDNWTLRLELGLTTYVDEISFLYHMATDVRLALNIIARDERGLESLRMYSERCVRNLWRSIYRPREHNSRNSYLRWLDDCYNRSKLVGGIDEVGLFCIRRNVDEKLRSPLRAVILSRGEQCLIAVTSTWLEQACYSKDITITSHRNRHFHENSSCAISCSSSIRG